VLIAYTISLISRIFIPQHVVLINQKLQGYWLITIDNKVADENARLRILKFDKCKKDAHEAKACKLSWRYVDGAAVAKKKLAKTAKVNWPPEYISTYWVEKKKDKETKHTIFHFEDYTNISLNVLKKEMNIYKDTTIVQQEN
jgi:hypothetical protein